jgi:hypothetical protein
MTEAQWLDADQPDGLIEYLRTARRVNRSKAGRRKLRLFACGCCRSVWGLFRREPEAAALVEAAERFADGELSPAALEHLDQLLPIPTNYTVTAGLSLRFAARHTASSTACGAGSAAFFCAQARAIGSRDFHGVMAAELARAAALFRCVFGNPFREVTFVPGWRTNTAVGIASRMYGSRDFNAMPILADALQDAGCDSEDVLNHCHGPGPHVRGCWAADLVLGKG